MLYFHLHLAIGYLLMTEDEPRRKRTMATPLLLPCELATTLTVAGLVTGPMVPYVRYSQSPVVSKPSGADGKMIGGFSKCRMCRIDQRSQEASSKNLDCFTVYQNICVSWLSGLLRSVFFKLRSAKTLRRMLLTPNRCKMSSTATVGFHLTVRPDYESCTVQFE